MAESSEKVYVYEDAFFVIPRILKGRLCWGKGYVVTEWTNNGGDYSLVSCADVSPPDFLTLKLSSNVISHDELKEQTFA